MRLLIVGPSTTWSSYKSTNQCLCCFYVSFRFLSEIDLARSRKYFSSSNRISIRRSVNGLSVGGEHMKPFKRSMFPIELMLHEFYLQPLQPHTSNNSEPNYIHPDRGQETHTHSKHMATYTHPSLCVFVVWNCVHPWGGQLVQNYYTGTFSPAYITHTDKQDRLCVCGVCVCVEAYRALLCGRRGPRGELWW